MKKVSCERKSIKRAGWERRTFKAQFGDICFVAKAEYSPDIPDERIRCRLRVFNKANKEDTTRTFYGDKPKWWDIIDEGDDTQPEVYGTVLSVMETLSDLSTNYEMIETMSRVAYRMGGDSR